MPEKEIDMLHQVLRSREDYETIFTFKNVNSTIQCRLVDSHYEPIEDKPERQHAYFHIRLEETAQEEQKETK